MFALLITTVEFSYGDHIPCLTIFHAVYSAHAPFYVLVTKLFSYP